MKSGVIVVNLIGILLILMVLGIVFFIAFIGCENDCEGCMLLTWFAGTLMLPSFQMMEYRGESSGKEKESHSPSESESQTQVKK